MAEKNAELVKNIMINLGVLLILVSAIASKDLSVVPFILGLVLLAIQTMDFKIVAPKKLVTAEIIIALSLTIATVLQLVLSKGFGTPQVFMIILLLGAILITVEAVRKYADL